VKAITHLRARSWTEAAKLSQGERQAGRVPAFAAGGSDLLALLKDRVMPADAVVSLRDVSGADGVMARDRRLHIGALMPIDAVARHPSIARDYAVLAEAAGSVGSPQIRNAGTLGGNVCQRPWCWYFRNGFKCFKAGGNTCYSVAGENEFHAIFGGGPSYIVHPSDTAPALVALDATFHIVGPAGERTVPAREFFVLPKENAAQEHVLGPDEMLTLVDLPAPRPGARSTYRKVMDREAWTHAVVSVAAVLEMDGPRCRSARVVLGGVAPIPWRTEAAERLLAGRRLDEAALARAADAAVEGARAMSGNAYKIPLTRALVHRTLADLARQA